MSEDYESDAFESMCQEIDDENLWTDFYKAAMVAKANDPRYASASRLLAKHCAQIADEMMKFRAKRFGAKK